MQRVKEFPDEGLVVSGSGFSLRIIGGCLGNNFFLGRFIGDFFRNRNNGKNLGNNFLKPNSCYRISSKNSASLIFRHPFTQMGKIVSNFGKGIPKYFGI